MSFYLVLVVLVGFFKYYGPFSYFPNLTVTYVVGEKVCSIQTCTNWITSSYFLYEVLVRCDVALGTTILIELLKIWKVSTPGDYLNDYNTQTKYICLDGDYTMD